MSEIKIQRGISLQQTPPNPDARLREASQMYEQHFLNEMVKAMRKTVEHSKMTEPTMAEKIYAEQLDSQYVESWSNRGGVGLADIIYDQLQDRFFNRGGKAPHPQGPIEIQNGTTIKIDESQPTSVIPILDPKSSLPKNEVSVLYQWDADQKPSQREIKSPFAGDVLQNFRVGDDRNIVKIAHDDGLTSTLSYIGRAQDLQLGERVEAGQKLGSLSPESLGLTWHLAQAET